MKRLTKFKFPFDFPFKVYTSFVVIMVISLALGYVEQFFMMFFVVTFHELAHVTVAAVFKIHTEKVIFTALGEIAVMKGLTLLEPYKKILIITAGPLANLLLGLFFLLFTESHFVFLRNVNFALAVFNMLPVYPLDGGRLLQVVLGNGIGVMAGNKVIFYMSRMIGFCIMLLGGIQVVLYPFNVSLLCLGLYIHFINKKEYFHVTFEFYKVVVMQRYKITKKLYLPAKFFLISEKADIKKVINMLCWDIIYIFHVHQNGELIYILTEQQIVDYVKNYGLNGTLKDVEKYL